MSNLILQPSQFIQTNQALSTKPYLPFLRPSPPPRHHRNPIRIVSFSPAHAGTELLERCYRAAAHSSSGGAVMKKQGGGYGAFGTVTLEKSKLDTTQKEAKVTPEVAIGGGGGDIGKKNRHGGGDGGDDGGDDDDYTDDFDDGDEGDEGGLFRRCINYPEIFKKEFLDAVLNEWQKTMMDLPAGLRQAYDMGLVSSAQLVRFLAINARPTTARFISRTMPQGISRAFIGRMIADPAFLYKFILEQVATVGCCVYSEVKNRKERIKQEWDLALINVLTVTACNAIAVWSLAPCRSYGNTFRFDLQNTLQKLPNNIFERSYPQREFELHKRVLSFIFKAAELSMVGFTAGAVQGGLTKLHASKKEGRLSVTVPSVSNNALGYGGFLGLYANFRHQLLWGMDRALINHFDVIGLTIFVSTAMRVMNIQLGETSRLAWLGIEVDPLANSDDILRAYNRPESNATKSSSNWLISKNAIVSGLGLFGIKQGQQGNSNAEGETPAPKVRRKRIVKRKVSTAST